MVPYTDIFVNVQNPTTDVFMALAAGAVPVYTGPKSSIALLPHPDCIIYSEDFESPEALVGTLAECLLLRSSVLA